ncbi:unnamed protein product [Rhodiola kirilowii]
MDNNPGPDTPLSPTSLLCFETEDSLNHTSHDFDQEFIPSRNELISPQEDDDYVTAMLVRENVYEHLGAPADVSSEFEKGWIADARFDSIVWILEKRRILGFRYRTAYLSIMYFDRFLSLECTALKGKLWAIRLLALTCLSLSAKMEEVDIAPLWAYSGGRYAAFNFPNDLIKRMELKVLYSFGWNMGFVSPFCLLHFFIRKFQALPHGGRRAVVASAAWIIFEAAKENSTMCYRPSVVAAAATLAAMDGKLSKEDVDAKIRSSTVSDYGFTASVEQLHSCYEFMKDLYPYNSPKSLVESPDPGSSSASSQVQNANIQIQGMEDA